MAGGGVAARRGLAAAPHAVADAPALDSALPVGGGDPDPALVEDFYERRGARARVQVSPTEALRGTSMPRWRALAGSTEGPTDVLVADSDSLLSRTTLGDVTLTARPDAQWVAAWAACEERPDADVHARKVLARIEPPTAYALAEDRWASAWPSASAAGRACSAWPRRWRTPPRHRGPRGARADGLGRPAWRAADLPTGAERQRPRARAVRRAQASSAHTAITTARPRGEPSRARAASQRLVDLGRTLEPAISLARSCWISR